MTDDTTKRNYIFSFSVTNLFALIETLKHLQFFLQNVHFRKLKTRAHRHYFMFYIKVQYINQNQTRQNEASENLKNP